MPGANLRQVSDQNPGSARRQGRKRLLDPVTERRRLLEAGLRLLDEDRITLEGVLAEAGMSTRAFYRQFSSFDALVFEVRHEEIARLGARLEKLVGSASGSLEALEVFVDDLLAVGYELRRVGRATAIRRSDQSADLRRDSLAELSRPLHRVIVQGVDEGVFFSPHPAVDASTICSILLDVVGDAGTERQRLDLPAARTHVMRFALAALAGSSIDEIRSQIG